MGPGTRGRERDSNLGDPSPTAARVVSDLTPAASWTRPRGLCRRPPHRGTNPPESARIRRYLGGSYGRLLTWGRPKLPANRFLLRSAERVGAVVPRLKIVVSPVREPERHPPTRSLSSANQQRACLLRPPTRRGRGGAALCRSPRHALRAQPRARLQRCPPRRRAWW